MHRNYGIWGDRSEFVDDVRYVLARCREEVETADDGVNFRYSGYGLRALYRIQEARVTA